MSDPNAPTMLTRALADRLGINLAQAERMRLIEEPMSQVRIEFTFHLTRGEVDSLLREATGSNAYGSIALGEVYGDE